MNCVAYIRLVILFGLVIYGPSVAGLSAGFRLEVVPLAHANPQGSDDPWIPAGPAMDTLFEPGYSDRAAAYNALEKKQIDFVDQPMFPDLTSTYLSSPNYLVTDQKWVGFYQLEFNLANNFWGCPMNFGNAVLVGTQWIDCGREIRQGIAHLIDRTKFAANEPHLSGSGVSYAQAIDNPLSGSSGLLSPNPCNWDTTYTQTDSTCKVGAPGGTAYHLASAQGVVPGYSWMPANPSPDFCLAARHISTGINSILTPAPPPGNSIGLAKPPGGGFPSAPASSWTFDSSTDCTFRYFGTASQQIAAHPANIFTRSDNPTLESLAISVTQEVCALFTGSFRDTYGCDGNFGNPGGINFLSLSKGDENAFSGYLTSTGSSPTTNWWLYTAGAGSFMTANPFEGEERSRAGQLGDHFCKTVGCDPFDTALFYTFNGRFVSGINSIRNPNGPCSPQSVPNGGAPNYLYICNSSYDSISSQIEYAPCYNAPADPIAGDANNGPGGKCLATNQLSAISAGIQAEDAFGAAAFAIPLFTLSAQYAFLNGWHSVINNGGTFNYFNLLNAWNTLAPGSTMNYALSGNTRSLNPYVAVSSLDFAVLGGVYDSILVSDPYAPGQVIDWMDVSSQALPTLTYTPPPGTAMTYRFTLRNDLFWQNGDKLTSFDVAFSYLSLMGTGSLLGATLADLSGITILSPHQLDINMKSSGPFTKAAISASPILPGRIWTSQSSNWLGQVSTCTANGAPCYPAQYTFGLSQPGPSGYVVQCSLTCTFLPEDMVVDVAKIVAGYDPIASGLFIGSGPWQCGSDIGLGKNCSSTGTQNPGLNQAYTFTRFGKGLAPASSISGMYFRSNSNLALWIWSQNNGNLTHDFLNFAAVASCFGKPVTGLTTGCGHFQQGIGAGGGAATPVGLTQVSVVHRFLGLNWVSPFDWTAGPPVGIISLNPVPVLHEGSVTLSPASAVGCPAGYDC